MLVVLGSLQINIRSIIILRVSINPFINSSWVVQSPHIVHTVMMSSCGVVWGSASRFSLLDTQASSSGLASPLDKVASLAFYHCNSGTLDIWTGFCMSTSNCPYLIQGYYSKLKLKPYKCYLKIKWTLTVIKYFFR